MVRSNSPKVKLDVQARFEQVHDSPYGEVKASMLTAIAAKDNVSATVEVKKLQNLIRIKMYRVINMDWGYSRQILWECGFFGGAFNH